MSLRPDCENLGTTVLTGKETGVKGKREMWDFGGE